MVFLKISPGEKKAQQAAKGAGAAWQPACRMWVFEVPEEVPPELERYVVDYDGHEDRLIAVLGAILSEMRALREVIVSK